MPNEYRRDFQSRHLRMFEVSRSDVYGQRTHLAIDLPTAWARRHASAEVLLTQRERLGWGAELVGDHEEHLLGFPWYDHVDEMLLEHGSELPPDLESGTWEDLEQGWWGSIRVDGPNVFIAEADFDDVLTIQRPDEIAQQRRGVVSVGGVEVFWNRVARSTYDGAWARACERVRTA